MGNKENECPQFMEGKNIIETIKKRWKAQIPVFFKYVLGFGTSLAAIALAIQMALNSSGAHIPQWWEDLYPYLIGSGAGMAATAKLTQQPPCDPK